MPDLNDAPETRKARAVLYKKIASVAAQMKRVPKNGKNTFHNYTYTTESDLTDAIRDLLLEHGLAFLPPTVLSHERIEAKAGPLARVEMQFTLACCDTGETVTSVLWADGQDAADKGFYKAYTGGVKYFLMKTFLVSTGDDPEDAPPARNGNGAQYQEPERRPVQGATPRPRVPTVSAQQAEPDDLPPPRSVAPSAPPALSATTRATMVTRIREHMRRAQSFGFEDRAKLAIDLESLNDAELTEAGKVWKTRADELARADANAVPA